MRRSARPGPSRRRPSARPLSQRGKKGLCDQLAAEAAAEVGRLAAGVAASLAGGAGIERAELALREGLAQLGCAVLEPLLAADAGYRGPHAKCGAGHQAGFAGYRDKTIGTVPGPVAIRRAWYHCAECGHRFAPRDAGLGVAGQGMSPGLRKMTARAAAAVPFTTCTAWCHWRSTATCAPRR